MRNKYQRKDRKSNHKFEVVRGQELLVRVPLPMAEVWAEMQAQVEELTGQAGLQILRAILEEEVTRRVGPPHRPNPTAGCVRWGKQSGYVVFGGQKIPLERPRVRTREGQEVELESYGQLQQNGKLQSATAPAPATLALRRSRTCDWTCGISSGICFSRRLSPLKRDSQPELYPSSGESRCFLFPSFN